jgi:hypothetical protein
LYRRLLCREKSCSGAPGTIRIRRLQVGTEHSLVARCFTQTPNLVGRRWQDGMLGIPSRKQLEPFVRSRRAHESREDAQTVPQPVPVSVLSERDVLRFGEIEGAIEPGINPGEWKGSSR